jgi:exonuclease III
MPVLHDLCSQYDILLLQEHWLLPHELFTLKTLHNDFYATASSAVDTSSGMLIGRPYGGVAILYRKSLASCIDVFKYDDERIIGITLSSNVGSLLILCVYMPTNYGDAISLESYVEYLGKLQAIISQHPTMHTIIAGDFNCASDTNFFVEFNKFVIENKLIVSDMSRVNSACTYFSDDGMRSSWLDHFVCSTSIDSIIDNVEVLYDVIVSDHKPLVCSVSLQPTSCVSHANASLDGARSSFKFMKPLWHKCDNVTLDNYQFSLDNLLQTINIPFDLFVHPHTDLDSVNAIDKLCDDIFSSMQRAVSECIPSRCDNFTEYNIAGWNSYVADKHDAARAHFLQWIQDGKPRSGGTYDLMRKSRAQFKLAFRQCKRSEDVIKADIHASSLCERNYGKFWHNIQKDCNERIKCQVSSIGEANGPTDIAMLWHDHFKQLYGKGVNSTHKAEFEDKLKRLRVDRSEILFTVGDIVDAISKLKKNKSAGPDGLFGESFIYGGMRLCTMLTFLFNLCVRFSYVPKQFAEARIIPLVKSKAGDLSDVNNYRAISVSNCVTKLFELILFKYLDTQHNSDTYQFGFKKGLSTTVDTFAFKRVVKYYTHKSSYVFTAFIDFNKAFDNVDYWLLFNKLLAVINDNAGLLAILVICFLYSHQVVHVLWSNLHSPSFAIHNGVRQGGPLSPYFFSVYIRDLIGSVCRAKTGCFIGNVCVNVLAYADDIVLMAPTWHALQFLLNTLQLAADNIDMSVNVNKTVCMIFKPRNPKFCLSSQFPSFTICGIALKFVNEFKYLGHIVSNDQSDNLDIRREIRLLFARTNILKSRFKACSALVKKQLFQAYCLCFYDIALWDNYSRTSLLSFKSAYNKCIKCFFGFDRYFSVTCMLFELSLPSFDTLLLNSKTLLTRRLLNCSNSVICNLLALGACI